MSRVAELAQRKKEGTYVSPKGLKGFEPTRTQQHFKNEVNINQIMRKARKTGIMPMGINEPAMYGDFSEVGSYQEALQKINDANERFMSFPANIRKRFENNPQLLFQFLQSEDNRAEAIELGLIENPEKPVMVGDEKIAPEGAGNPSPS